MKVRAYTADTDVELDAKQYDCVVTAVKFDKCRTLDSDSRIAKECYGTRHWQNRYEDALACTLTMRTTIADKTVLIDINWVCSFEASDFDSKFGCSLLNSIVYDALKSRKSKLAPRVQLKLKKASNNSLFPIKATILESVESEIACEAACKLVARHDNDNNVIWFNRQ